MPTIITLIDLISNVSCQFVIRTQSDLNLAYNTFKDSLIEKFGTTPNIAMR